MAARTLADVNQDLAEAREALSSIISGGQAYGLHGRSQQRVDAKWLEMRIARLELERDGLSNPGRAGGGVVVDIERGWR